MDTKDRVYIYGIAALLGLSALIGLEALYETHQPNPVIATLPMAPAAPVTPTSVEPTQAASVPDSSPIAPVEPDHAAYPVDPREPDASASKRAGLRENESKAAILLVAVEADDRVSTVDIEHTSGSVVTDGAAIEYARGLNWTSARKSGKQAASVVRYVVRFQR